MRRENHPVAELQQGDFVFARQHPQKVDMLQSQLGGVFFQLCLNRAGADDDHRVTGALQRIQQNVQPLEALAKSSV